MFFKHIGEVEEVGPNAPLGVGPEGSMSPSSVNETPRLWSSAPFPSSGERLWAWHLAHIPACLPLHSSQLGEDSAAAAPDASDKNPSHHPPYSCHPGRPCLSA